MAPPPNQYAWRHTSSVFKLTIPVDTKTDLLEREERHYAILQFIAHSIPSASRWFAVFERYLKQVGGRVKPSKSPKSVLVSTGIVSLNTPLV